MSADYPAPLIIIGPSGAGKSTIASALQDGGDYEILRSYTTRPRRQHEDDSTHYFVTDAEFDHLSSEDRFIGSTELFGHRYALPHIGHSPKRPIILLRAPLVALAQQLFPGCIVISLKAPIKDLVDRIKSRGDTDRALHDDLAREMQLGEQLAVTTIDTSSPLEVCVAEIRRVFDKT